MIAHGGEYRKFKGEKMQKTLKERYLDAKRIIIMKYLSAKLNPEQSRAVCSVNGPVLIIAGAGSGKTTVLVNRITFILKYGDAYFSDEVPQWADENYVADMEAATGMSPQELEDFISEFAVRPCPPYAMLAITFTNKAAKEIKDRLAASLYTAQTANDIWTGTFHSVCVRILRKFGDRIGYGSDFSIYDTDDKKHLIADVMKSLEISDKTLNPKTVANEISHAKDCLVPAEEYDTNGTFKGKQIGAIYTEYQRRIKACNALDFDDIIAETVYLLEKNPDVAEYYQNKFRYICVDEYQDTNYAQFRLTEIISRKNRNIMVVGDDDQSIYKFRGATIENILNFDKTYPEAKVIRLEQNYRSTKTILDAANAIIAKNENRHEKRLWCDNVKGEKITVHRCFDQKDESRYIAGKVSELVSGGEYTYRDFAVLYRVNEIARSLETAFTMGGMPYRILGGQRFYDKKEIKDIIAYLHVIENDRDDQRLKRIINEPKRKIGAATVDAVETLAAESGKSMLDIMRESPEIMLLSKSADKLSAFVKMIDDLRSDDLSLPDLVEQTFVRSGYKKMLLDAGEVEKPRIDAVEEFISAAKEFEDRNEGGTLSEFLEEIALVSDVDKYDENSDAVVMMTVHSAKGLEFPVVFLAGMEDGIFPSSQSLYSEEEMSEERRLAYVAVTRAKNKLFITHTKSRLLYGTTMYNMISRFVEEIPGNLLDIDVQRENRNGFSAGGAHYPGNSDYFGEKKNSAFAQAQRLSREFMRKPAESMAPPKNDRVRVERLEVGTRVKHAVFGDGEIISLREMGGDLLYEVKFDSGTTKKLMATFAKLQKI